MQKAKEYDVATSNLANFGTEVEAKVKAASAAGEDQWKGAGKVVGLKIWRMENFKVVPSATSHGVFYEDDSYIILRTYKKEDALRHDIHFWLGRTTSADEAGTAAYKTVELDTYLGGGPVQHREVADHESDQFLSYFKDFGGVRILSGGVASGFNIVKPEEYRPRLLWLKGRKHIRVKEVPAEAASLNSGDVFILDAGLVLHQWQGSAAGPREKMRAAQLVRAIDDERRGKPVVKVIEEGDTEGDAQAFWEALGGEGPVKGADEVEEDAAWEKASEAKLFKLSDESSDPPAFTLAAEGEGMSRDLLDTNDVFVFDAGHEIFVWVGKGANANERKHAMKYAQDYVSENDRPAFLPITLIYEGGENEHFEHHFA